MVIATLWLKLLSPCWAGEHQQILLTSGEELIAEVLESREEGLRVQTPQGVRWLPYPEIQEASVSTQEAFQAQPPLRVLSLGLTPADTQWSVADAGSWEQDLLDALSDIPQVQLLPSPELSPGLRSVLELCGADAQCALAYLPLLDADRVWIGTVGAQGLRVSMTTVTLHPQTQHLQQGLSRGALADSQALAHRLLGVELQRNSAPPASFTPRRSTARDAPTAASSPPPPRVSQPLAAPIPRELAWVPLPGFPALVQRDVRTFAKAWAIAAPTALAWAGLAGSSAFRRDQFITLGVAGYALSTIAINHLLFDSISPPEGLPE